MGLLIFKFPGVLAALFDRKWVSNGSYSGSTRVYYTRPDCVDTLRMPTMKVTSSIFLSKVILLNPLFFYSFLFYYVHKIHHIFYTTSNYIGLFEAIEFEGNLAKLSYYKLELSKHN